jgi:glycopeptide antibiotics resistance protein
VCGSGARLLSVGWGLLPLLVIVPLYLWRHDLRDPRTWLGLAAIVYLDLLLSLTFFPLPLPPYQLELASCRFIYLRPFSTIGPALSQGLRSPEMQFLIGNVLAFMPVGVLLPLLRRLRRELAAVLVAGFLLSLAIEIGQLAVSMVIGFPYRQADVDDVIANTLGAVVGYGLLVSLRRVRRRPNWFGRGDALTYSIASSMVVKRLAARETPPASVPTAPATMASASARKRASAGSSTKPDSVR